MGRVTISELNELKERADGVIAELQNAKNKYTQAVNSIDEELSSVNANIETIKNIEGQAQQIRRGLEENEEVINQGGKKLGGFSSKIDDLENALSEKEDKLTSLIKNSEELERKVENLFPGATSANLSSAFLSRKKSFAFPKWLWAFTFFISITALVLVAFFNPYTFDLASITEENVFTYIFIRLPFIGPIIWLGVYAGRRHGQALRLEEDYAHKEVLSKSFEGYKKQLIDIEKDGEPHKATKELINRTLTALALHPDRIYSGKQKDITPLNSLKDGLASSKSDEMEK